MTQNIKEPSSSESQLYNQFALPLSLEQAITVTDYNAQQNGKIQESQLAEPEKSFNNQFNDNQAGQKQLTSKIQRIRGQQTTQRADEIVQQKIQDKKQQIIKEIVIDNEEKIMDKKVSSTQSKKKTIKNRLKKSIIFQKQSIIEQKPLNLQQIQQKIKQIARTIRQKVKKDEKIIFSQKRKEQSKHRKNIQRQANINLITVTKDFITEPTNTLLLKRNNKILIRQIVQSLVLDKVDRLIEINEKIKRTQVKLDPIKHKYPMNSFRKSILAQHKMLLEEDVRRSKQREGKLMKRKEIFTNSRYERYTSLIKKQNSKRNISYLGLPDQQLIKIPIDNPQINYPTLSQQEKVKGDNIFPAQISQQKVIPKIQPQNYQEQFQDEDY